MKLRRLVCLATLVFSNALSETVKKLSVLLPKFQLDDDFSAANFVISLHLTTISTPNNQFVNVFTHIDAASTQKDLALNDIVLDPVSLDYEAEEDVSVLAPKFIYQTSINRNSPGMHCFVKTQPGVFASASESPLTALEDGSKQLAVKAISAGLIQCTKLENFVNGFLVLQKRDFEFYNNLSFKVAVEDADTGKGLFENVIYLKTNSAGEKPADLALNEEDVVKAFQLSNSVLYGTHIRIQALSLTTDYYSCEVDKSEGKLYDNLEVVVRCKPRSSKYDTFYYFAVCMGVFMLVSLAVSVLYHFKKGSV